MTHRHANQVVLLVSAYDNGLGLTPQMGWNPWNVFRCDINENLIREIASSMVSTGLSDLGYKYINIDDCWQVSRNGTGHIVEDPQKFPSGMAALSKHIREDLGLRFGLYSDSGMYTCQRRPGGLGYEQQDAESYVVWEIDYLKYDNCYATGLGGGVQKRYETMRDALNQTATSKNSKPIFFGLCEWGNKDPATWAGSIGNSWRTTGDIQKSWTSVLDILDKNDQWHSYAGPGGWNDPDMLQVGTTTKLTITEQRAHFTLWCLIKAPLLLANDLRDIPDDVMEIISNPEVIAINQDPLGVQGNKRWSHSGLEVWAGVLEGGEIAVVLFNRSENTETIVVRFEDVVAAAVGRSSHHHETNNDTITDNIGPIAIISANVRDLWKRSDLGVFTNEFRGDVPSHGVMALRLSLVSIEKIQ
jgi:alpha-galactosidase